MSSLRRFLLYLNGSLGSDHISGKDWLYRSHKDFCNLQNNRKSVTVLKFYPEQMDNFNIAILHKVINILLLLLLPCGHQMAIPYVKLWAQSRYL